MTTLPAESSRFSILRLVSVPALITLAVTILRLAGELMALSKILFNADPGGFLALVGIVWLVPVFGIYFSLKMASAGLRPERSVRAVGLAATGFVMLAGGFVLLNYVEGSIRNLILMWTLAAAGAVIQAWGWRLLFKVLLAYAYAARIPVAFVMLIATIKGWQSHYSASVMPPSEMSLVRQYILFAFIPQLVWWVSFTIIVGMLLGSVAAAIAGRGRRPGEIPVT